MAEPKVLGMISVIPESLNSENILTINNRKAEEIFTSGTLDAITAGDKFILNIRTSKNNSFLTNKIVTVTKVYEYIVDNDYTVRSLRFGYTFDDATMTSSVKEYVLPLQNFIRYGNTMGCTIDYGAVNRSDLVDNKKIIDEAQEYVQRHYNTISMYGDVYNFHSVVYVQNTMLGDLSNSMYPDMENPPAEIYYLNAKVCCIFTKKKPISNKEMNMIKHIMQNVVK